VALAETQPGPPGCLGTSAAGRAVEHGLRWRVLGNGRSVRKPFLGGVFVRPRDAIEERPTARVFWLEACNPAVVAVDAEQVPQATETSFDLARFRDMADVLKDCTGRELIVLSDGQRQIQFSVRQGTVLEGPVHLRYHIEGFDHIAAKTLTLARLHALVRYGRFPIGLFPPEPNAPKWAKALQAHDASIRGASQRDIAAALFGHELVKDEWNGRSDFLRTRTHRLLSYGKRMVGGGYRELLDR